MTRVSAFGMASNLGSPCTPDGFFVVAAPDRAEDFRDLISGRNDVLAVDPWRASSAVFIDRLNVLQQETHPEEAPAIPPWALYDCAQVTGLVAGLRRGDEPVSMLAATPMLLDGDWHLFGLCGRPGVDPVETLRWGRSLIRPRRCTAVARWASETMRVMASGSPTEVLTAWTAAHSTPDAATLRIDHGAETPTGGEMLRLNARDENTLRALQERLERGERFRLIGPPDRAGIAVLEVLAP